MSSDYTQQQSSEDQRRSRKLSLQSTTPPTEVPGYETQRFLGSGAYGEVWVGVDQNTGRRVAIKFFSHRGGVDWSLLSREVEKLAVLSADRYVVQLLDVGWDSDPPYYVMDYIENGSLEDALRDRGTFSLPEAVEMFREVAVGLMHLHGKGVLHCDLKPANVLLDEDNKPRLADFGQSRLSHEQSPALGTLFFMAPEQASLDAVPDARWDVYALGALLYCMLTGEPPYRSDELLRTIEAARDLDDRLARYRQAIQNAPRPIGHRQLRGVDRAVVEIIDRCLAVDPKHRFASVQSVFEALHARDDARIRRPLMMLGLVGPLLLLLIMTLFGVRGYGSAVHDSKVEVERRVKEGNNFFAKSVARTIEEEIPRYFAACEKEAKREDFYRDYFQPVIREELTLRKLTDPASTDVQRDARREVFLDDPTRVRLKEYLEQRLATYLAAVKQDSRALKFASIFVTDRRGTIVAAAYDDEQTRASKSVGRNYAWRTYFHGGPADLPETQSPDTIQPIRETQLSAVFHSTTTRTWKVAVSTPVHDPDDGSFQGVMVLTIELGNFTFFRNASNSKSDHFAVLVDGRKGPSKGTILQHPFFRDQQQTEEDYSQEKYRVDLEQLEHGETDQQFRYRDPFGQAPGGDAYGGDWIAAMEWVRLPLDEDSPREPNGHDTGLVVIVQENYNGAIAPINRLGARLIREGSLALTVVVLVVCVLWFFVVRMLGRGGGSSRGANGGRAAMSSLHSMQTLSAPKQRSRAP